jgi:hypothetical protein
MSWRVARAIRQLFDELNAAAPNRSKKSDGTIGDAAHATRASDHNPWITDPATGQGVVSAGDFTDDDTHGADMSRIVDYLTKVSHDRRIKYLIHRGKIYSSYPTAGYPAWAARPYTGINAHMHHLHVSVLPEPYHYDDARPWGIAKALHPDTAKTTGTGARAPRWPLPPGSYFGPESGPKESVSGYHSHASDLRLWQAQMRRRGWRIGVTGRYDQTTADTATAFRRQVGLGDSAAIGPRLWAAAWTARITKD